jgi:hypothetical protein
VTTVINLYAGPGSGKSTRAAEVFAVLKGQGVSCELVTEWVKEWAWRGERIEQNWDGVYITAQQARRERAVYGKVDYIITDSPLGLGAVFERVYSPENRIVYDLVRHYERQQDAAGVRRVNCLLTRSKPFVQAGRYEDEAAARRVDRECEEFLRKNKSGKWHRVAGTSDVLALIGVQQ